MITYDDYVGIHKDSPDLTENRKQNIFNLLSMVNRLLSSYCTDGRKLPINPATKSNVSGQTFGGFRPQSCPQGAARSAHKEGLAVDIYDPQNELDGWCRRDENLMIIEALGIYFEHESKTPHWCHMTIKAPSSGNRWFYP